jgi:NAD-dependent deacetylase
MHGNLWEVKCAECGEVTLDRSPNLGKLPKCSKCRRTSKAKCCLVRESLDPDIMHKAGKASKNCDLMLIVGTSGSVQPAASFTYQAQAEGALVVEINIEQTPQSGQMDFVLHDPAGKILPMLVEDFN